MDLPDDHSASQIAEWASRQLADFDARCPGSLFAEGLVLNELQAYAIQSAVAQIRHDRGEHLIGYKVGCTSPKIRQQLGIDHCVVGRLFASEQYSSRCDISRKAFANLAIEGELAVQLSREPTNDDFRATGIPNCVARVFPVIELHHHLLRSAQPSSGELIAHNAIHAGFVESTGKIRSELNDELSLEIFANDRSLGKANGPSLIDTLNSSLKWLAEFVQERGDHLRSGEIVLTGSIPSLIPIHEDCRIRIDAGPLGITEAHFIA